MPETFSTRLIRWQKTDGRHHLPWQNTRDPYRIWLSEIMLQQTQVETVVGYYLRFLAAFPTVAALAVAPLERVLELWSGLGYYRRAHHLHAAAQQIVARGGFPETATELAELPGVGRSTAAAIAVFAFDQRAAILDGNVRRVLTRHQGLNSETTGEPQLWALTEQLLPRRDLVAYTQGLMDLGAQICTRSQPACLLCPVRADCVALADPTAFAPKRPSPRVLERAFAMLMLWRRGKVFLEARDTQTIWQGLWSFPECDATSDQAIRRFVSDHYGLTVKTLSRQPEFIHRLTHRKLRITPIHVGVSGRLRGNGQFVTRAEALVRGLPTPVRRLLEKEG